MTDNKYIHNVETDEIQIVEMTAEEIAQREADIAKWQADKAIKQAEAEGLWRTKVSAYEKLGLTEDEIEAIAPTPKWLLPPEEQLA